MRAIWITRFDYRTAADVVRIVNECADAGFDTLLLQVRGNGTVSYKSRLEPWADELGGGDPGFDPLALACVEAHRRGVELHAWVNVMPTWRGLKPPSNPAQLYNARPEWFWYDQSGGRQALSEFYVSLNPCLPEVRSYLLDVLKDLITRYDIDGVHLDYIRFPNEPPATPIGSSLDYPRDDRTLALYREETGLVPENDSAAWDRWRTECVTRLVADVRELVRYCRPSLVLSAAVGPVPEKALLHFQDGRRWVEEGLVDVVFLMNYTDDPALFADRLKPWIVSSPKSLIVPGIWFGKHEEATEQQFSERIMAVQKAVVISLQQCSRFCIFSYAALFDPTADKSVSPDTPLNHTRRRRMDMLRPYLQVPLRNGCQARGWGT